MSILGKPMLSLEEVDVYYEDLQALWGVSMEVHEGELVALVGPNGAGKTTALRAISGLLSLPPDASSFEAVILARSQPTRSWTWAYPRCPKVEGSSPG